MPSGDVRLAIMAKAPTSRVYSRAWAAPIANHPDPVPSIGTAALAQETQPELGGFSQTSYRTKNPLLLQIVGKW